MEPQAKNERLAKQPQDHPVSPQATTSTHHKRRRRMLTAMAALGGGMVATTLAKAERVQAADGDALIVGTRSVGSSPGGSTQLDAHVPNDPGVRIINGDVTSEVIEHFADGVQGYATGANTFGAFGANNDPGGAGVVGISSGGMGLLGISTDSIGAGGTSESGTGVAATSSTGVALTALSALNDAGEFFGSVFIDGMLTVTGAVSAAVAHPDGGLRRTYALSSPENWFEDVGTSTLVAGATTVKLADDFAAVVRSDDYHVFITPEGDSNGLYVSSKSSTGFAVREQQGGKSTLPFSYRVVARLINKPGRRLDKVAVPGRSPQLKQLTLATPANTKLGQSRQLDRPYRRK
jgi:hypothetical protein